MLYLHTFLARHEHPGQLVEFRRLKCYARNVEGKIEGTGMAMEKQEAAHLLLWE